MKVITQREFRNNSAAVMDAVEAGEIYHVTRNGVAVAELRPLSRRRRLRSAQELLGTAIVDFDPLPFDGEAAARYGTLVALTVEAKRDPGPRRMDLMIAAVASAHDLPLFTRNIDDFVGLDDMVTVIAV